MKQSPWLNILFLFVLIPATLFLGRSIPGRWYYLTSTLVIVEIMVPFFVSFERRRPEARELVEEAVESAERARILRACMAELHADYREALFLVYFEGLSHAETAAVMGKREKQVADLIYRGKNALRKRLEQEGITDAYNG